MVMTGCSSLNSDHLREGIGLLLPHSPHPICSNALCLPRPQSTWVSDLQIPVLLPHVTDEESRVQGEERACSRSPHKWASEIRLDSRPPDSQSYRVSQKWKLVLTPALWLSQGVSALSSSCSGGQCSPAGGRGQQEIPNRVRCQEGREMRGPVLLLRLFVSSADGQDWESMESERQFLNISGAFVSLSVTWDHYYLVEVVWQSFMNITSKASGTDSMIDGILDVKAWHGKSSVNASQYWGEAREMGSLLVSPDSVPLASTPPHSHCSLPKPIVLTLVAHESILGCFINLDAQDASQTKGLRTSRGGIQSSVLLRWPLLLQCAAQVRNAVLNSLPTLAQPWASSLPENHPIYITPFL